MTGLAKWMRRRERTRIIGMKNLTSYAVLAKLVEELNEENEEARRLATSRVGDVIYL